MGFTEHLKLLQKHAPNGIDTDSWKSYRCTVSLVGIQHARKPYPDNPYWRKITKKRPQGRTPRGKVWDEFEGWISDNMAGAKRIEDTEDDESAMKAKVFGGIFTHFPEHEAALSSKLEEEETKEEQEEKVDDDDNDDDDDDDDGVSRPKIGDRRMRDNREEILLYRLIVRDSIPMKGVELKWVDANPETIEEARVLLAAEESDNED